MNNYKIAFKETQKWVYVYEITADTEEQAYAIAEDKFFKGEQSEDSFIDHAEDTGHTIEKA